MEKKYWAKVEFDGMGKCRGIIDVAAAETELAARLLLGPDQQDHYVAGGYPEDPVYRSNDTVLQGPYQSFEIGAAEHCGIDPDNVTTGDIEAWYEYQAR